MFRVQVLLSLFLVSFVAEANISYTYKNRENTIYEVVVSNPKGDTELAPGIYRIDKKSDESVPLLLGEVVGANRSYTGVLAYTATNSNTDSTHDILSIINGRIVLLNHNTSAKSPTSFVEIGGKSKSAVSAIDIVHGTEVEVPLIKDREDFSLVPGPVFSANMRYPNGARYYLASYKSSNPFGTGLTIGFLVDGTTDKNHKAKILENQVQVLGYDYLESVSLSRLLPNADAAAALVSSEPKLSLFSPLVISKFKNQLARLKDNPVATAWTDQITRFQNYLVKGLNKEDGNVPVGQLSLGVPQIDVFTGHESVNSAPIEMIQQSPGRFIGQSFDPNSGLFKVVMENRASISLLRVNRRELNFLGSANLANAVIATTPVDRAPKTGKYLFYGESTKAEIENNGPLAPTPTAAADILRRGGQTANYNGSDDQDAFLFFSEGLPTIMAKNSAAKGVYQTVALKTLNLNPADKLSFVRRRITINKQAYQVFFLLRKAERSEKSVVTTVVLAENDHLTFSYSEDIYDGPSMSLKEMNYRIVEEGGDLLFDKTTPVKGAVAYLKVPGEKPGPTGARKTEDAVLVPKKTVPYNRVFARNGGPPQTYRRSLTDTTLVPDHLYFREYDGFGAKLNATGFYSKIYSDREDKTETFFMGYPLFTRRERNSDRKFHVMQTKVLQSNDKSTTRFPPVNVSLIPYSEQLARKAKAKSAKKGEAEAAHREGEEGAAELNEDAAKMRPTSKPRKRRPRTKSPARNSSWR